MSFHSMLNVAVSCDCTRQRHCVFGHHTSECELVLFTCGRIMFSVKLFVHSVTLNFCNCNCIILFLTKLNLFSISVLIVIY